MEFRVRRANLEDIGALQALWQSMQFDPEVLARRVTEFQLVESMDGRLIGGIGLQMLERHGCIHSEAFTDFAFAEHARPLLWDRIQSLATSHGLLRLWTREDAPFWNRCGMAKPDKEALEKMPAVWRAEPGTWLTVKLREDLEALIASDKQFALFMRMERAKTEQLKQKARFVKSVVVGLAIILIFLLIAGAVWLLRNSSAFRSLGR